MDDLHEKIKPCFNYKGYNAWFKDFQPDISNFFMKHAEELDLHVCHYCELSYINVYGFHSVYYDFAAFLYNASDKELMKYIRRTDGLMMVGFIKKSLVYELIHKQRMKILLKNLMV